MGDASFGKYRLLAELGHGGMADVFLAVQAGPAGSGFRKLTVIKRLRANLAEDPEFIAMLVDEARIAARLNHPNVVQTNEIGEVGGQYFIAMEYLNGQPLHRIQHRAAQRAKAGTPALLTKEHQYLVVADALAGLHHAHELADYDGTPLHVVHRDVTPHNLFVTYEGQTKVVDFGIAKAGGRASETRQGIVKGKVRYMAPEQALGRNLDRRADVFTAGIILWEAATGRRMWKDMDDMQIVQALVGGNLPGRARELDPTVPERIDEICAKALAQRAEDRYESADAFRSDIEQYLADAGVLVDTRRTLGAMVCEIFSDKRAEITSIIERQLATIEDGGKFQPAVIPTDTTSSSSLSNAVGRAHTKKSAAESHAAIVTSAAPAPARRSRHLAIAAGALAAAAIVVAWRVGARSSEANVPVQQVDEVTLQFSGSPSHVKIRIDDGPAHVLPFEAKVPRDARDHVVRAEADGYVAREERVRFDRDARVLLDLKEVVPDAAAAASNKKPPTKPVAPPPTVVTITRTVQAPPPPPPVEPTAAATPTPHPPPEPTPHPTKKPKDGIDKGDPWASGGNK